MLAVTVAGLTGCDRGCVGLVERGLGAGARSSGASGLPPLAAVDCPDGLARCEVGTVSVSRLATVSMPCHGLASACSCPWDVLTACPGGCAADGVQVAVEGVRAAAQLCEPGRDAGVFATSPSLAPDAGEALCDEGDRYLCTGGRVIECASRAAVGNCLRGCFAEGTSIDDDGVSREAAFAILCSR